MKKIIILLIIIMMLNGVAFATEDYFDTLVPLREISEYLEAEVEWVQETKNIVITKDEILLEFKIGSKFYFSNGVTKELDSELLTEKGITMINAKIMLKEFPQDVGMINNYIVLAYTLKILKNQLPDEKAEKLKIIGDEVMVSIDNYSYIKTDNFYYNTPIWIKEKNKYVFKKVGDKDLYIRAGTLRKLINVDKDLRKEGYELVVFVAYRSYELQEHLREHYSYITGNYGTNAGLDVVAKAGKSNHQRGTAVDVKIRKLDGKAVEMPTEYLDFSKNSSIANHKDNEIVKIMQRIFKANGFKPYEREWWHFDDVDTSKYKPIKM